MMRSKLGGHIAGTGMESPTAQQFDDYVQRRGIKVPKSGMLPTDRFRSNKEGQKAFDEYCKEQSGEVVIHRLEDLKKKG